jgi:hypothetical protein
MEFVLLIRMSISDQRPTLLTDVLLSFCTDKCHNGTTHYADSFNIAFFIFIIYHRHRIFPGTCSILVCHFSVLSHLGFECRGPFGRPKLSSKDNTEMCMNVDQFRLAEVRYKWRAFVNTAMGFLVS